MPSSLNPPGVLGAEVIDWLASKLFHTNLEDSGSPDMQLQEKNSVDDIAQELQSHALDDDFSDHLIPSYGDLDITNATTASSSEVFPCGANERTPTPIRHRDAYTVLSSFLDNLTSVLKSSIPYYPRGALVCFDNKPQQRLRGVSQSFLQSKPTVSDSEETDAVKACRSLACLIHTRTGIDPSRSKKFIKLPGRLGVYEIVGRISCMYKVIKVKPKVARKLESENRDWCTTDQADVDWVSLTYRDTKELSTMNFFPSLIIKDSWLKMDEAAEVGQSMFRGVSCFFGVPEMLAAYEVKDCRGAPVTTRRLLSNHVTSSAVFGRSFKERVFHREIIKTEGKDLREAGTVQILLKAILHAMLGLYNVYLNGWIHQDVNINSVLLMVNPEVRRNDNLLCLTPERRQMLGNCIGMLVGDNQGIKEETFFDTTREVSDSGTPGTLPFMSIRLLQALALSTQTITTAIDDLESFIWVLCWAVVDVCLGHRKLNISEELLGLYLHGRDNFAMMAEDKRTYTSHLYGTMLPLGPSFSSITPLVEKWCAIATKYRRKVTFLLTGSDFSSDIQRSLNVLSKEAFGEYLDEGFRALDELECTVIDCYRLQCKEIEEYFSPIGR
ncbi:uncharacterized protein EV420DRAFT_1147754 [Desarmillaria tabescens]|uniref:Fungal-type protein kinase domain-containing protein n=1 Tax=Armillaria tabescens TaxID=1929756 RepID=A0AA39TTC3_ARMTA|nr:uncharacterized protein EV420DRAFT_1147754 [Desarmillaria tabescens]KAK0462989.1 hypothetical protein EV420DRAFT_1147754 [Desarmillaria tabescens]